MLIFDQLKKNDPQLRVVTWVVLAGMSLLFVGLYYVQVIASKHFVRDQEAQSFRTVRIPAVRGKILDRLGRPLAENRPSYDVSLYLNELRNRFTFEYTNSVKPAYLRATGAKGIPASDLAELFRTARYQAVSNIAQQVSSVLNQPVEIDPKEFHEHYNEARALPMPIVPGLDTTQLARFLERPNPTLGVDLDVRPLRFYPYHEMIAHVLGYLKRDTRSTVGEDAFVNYRLPDFSGLIGVEMTFDDDLRGKGGVKSVLVNSLGYRQSETIWTPAEPGKNVVLTINLDIQLAAYAALTGINIELLRDDATEIKGAAVVMDPRSGDLLAVVSVPAYDPNEFIPSIGFTNYQALQDPDRTPLINRAMQGMYPPGSTFKIVTGLACLEKGLDPLREFYNPGYIFVTRNRLIDDTAKPGLYNFERAFSVSSNTYFVTNGLAVGPEPLVQMGQQFLLGQRIGLPTGQEAAGHFPSLERVRKGWYNGDTANLSIGQGPVDVTPVQIAVLTAAVANGGKVLQPRLVMRVEPQDPHSEEPDKTFPSGVVRRELTVSRRSLDITRRAMQADVASSEGTGRAAAVPGLMACGKTGTAEISNAAGHKTDVINWFVSYAPAEDPRYVVVVMVENGRFGGDTCAPAARQIYQALLDLERGIPVRPLTMANNN